MCHRRRLYQLNRRLSLTRRRQVLCLISVIIGNHFAVKAHIVHHQGITVIFMVLYEIHVNIFVLMIHMVESVPVRRLDVGIRVVSGEIKAIFRLIF